VSILWYAVAGLAVVALGVFGTAAVLDGTAARGVLAAGAVAWSVQVIAFGFMARSRAGSNAFLLAWVGGTLVRLLVVGIAGLMLVALPGLPRTPTLVGLAAFFFMMLLLEPAFLRLDSE